jgi:hypothetical protein
LSAEFKSRRDQTIFDFANNRAPIIDLATKPKLVLPTGCRDQRFCIVLGDSFFVAELTLDDWLTRRFLFFWPPKAGSLLIIFARDFLKKLTV